MKIRPLFFASLLLATSCSSKTPVPASAPAPPKAPAGPTGTIVGVVKFTGTAPAMKVPSQRKTVEGCKNPVPYDAVVVTDGKLKDALVRIEPSEVKGTWDPPAPAEIDIKDCAFGTRMLGLLAGGRIQLKNMDKIDHLVNARKGDEALFQYALKQDAEPFEKQIESPGIYKLTDGDEPWARSFVVVTDHPFFAVSGADGSFTIEKVPIGRYMLHAWHTIYGIKKMPVEVNDGKTSTIEFTYAGNEPEPPENRGELKAMN